MVVTQLILAAKAALIEPSLTIDGAVNALTLNKDGRLRVSTKPGYYAIVTSTLANVNDQSAFDISSGGSLSLVLKNTSTTVTATAGSFVFEASPDSTNGTDGTWVSILGARSNANINESSIAIGSLAPGANFGFSSRFNVAGFKWFRIRCTASVTSGAVITVLAQQGATPYEPNPVIPVVTVNQQAGTAYAYTLGASINATVIKASSANLTELTVFNGSASQVYLKLYNQNTNPAPASNLPVTVIPVAAGAFVSYPFGMLGKRFPVGLAYIVTANAVATDATAPGAGVSLSATYV